MSRTKYEELWGYQYLLEESIRNDYDDDTYETIYDKAVYDIQKAYDNKEITKEQAEMLCIAMDIDIDY